MARLKIGEGIKFETKIPTEVESTSPVSLLFKVNSLIVQNKKQKIINYVFASLLILTIFLHLK